MNWRGRGKGVTAEERFLSKLTIGDGCWTLDASCDEDGYPRFSAPGCSGRALRFVYELFIGPIPAAHVVRHDCDNTSCVNPYHMRTGSIADNNRDRVERGRSRGPSISHCSTHGVPYVMKQGGRRCPVCRTEYMRIRDARRRAVHA